LSETKCSERTDRFYYVRTPFARLNSTTWPSGSRKSPMLVIKSAVGTTFRTFHKWRKLAIKRTSGREQNGAVFFRRNSRRGSGFLYSFGNRRWFLHIQQPGLITRAVLSILRTKDFLEYLYNFWSDIEFGCTRTGSVGRGSFETIDVIIG